VDFEGLATPFSLKVVMAVGGWLVVVRAHRGQGCVVWIFLRSGAGKIFEQKMAFQKKQNAKGGNITTHTPRAIDSFALLTQNRGSGPTNLTSGLCSNKAPSISPKRDRGPTTILPEKAYNGKNGTV